MQAHEPSDHGHAAHDHGDALRRTAAQQRRAALDRASRSPSVFVVVEAVTAFVTGSLALLSDAAHMLTDAVAIGLALGAIVVANRASHEGVAHLRAVPARDPRVARERAPHVRGGRLRARRSGAPARRRRLRGRGGPDARGRGRSGLAVNLVVFCMLRAGARGQPRGRGRLRRRDGRRRGSVGVIVAAVVIATTGWDPIDPIVAAVIGVWILPRAWHLAASALRVLLQVAPAARRPRRDPRRAARAPRRRRRARPPRVDAHVGDGRRQRARDDRRGRRRARRARPGPRAAPRPRDRARDHPGGARRPRRVRRAQLVTGAVARSRRRRAPSGAAGAADGRRRSAAATASPAPSPRVSATSTRRRSRTACVGHLGVAERRDVGEPAGDEQEDRGDEHQRHRRVDALRRHPHRARAAPSAIPAERVGALAPAWCRSTRCSRPRARSRAPARSTMSSGEHDDEHRAPRAGAADASERAPTASTTAPIDPRPRRRRRHVDELTGAATDSSSTRIGISKSSRSNTRRCPGRAAPPAGRRCP